MSDSISASRCRVNVIDASTYGSTSRSMAASKSVVKSAASRRSNDLPRNTFRSVIACNRPIVEPLPNDGLLQDQASPTGTMPVTTGTPSGR